ncbi:hypothetical protein [Paenibacillus sp. YAF4_2]|uniref:hypothetical protein n=1 Tax=Paenibacillus sp. YAF4_2 TaxID=3233085 RepID=UPI003F99D71B
MVFAIAQRKLDQQLFVYSKNRQSSEVYLGQLVDAQMVAIGPIGDVTYVQEITVNEEQLFGRRVVLVSGLCGAKCAVNDVLDEKDGRQSQRVV